MSDALRRPSPEAIAHANALANRTLTQEERAAAEAIPISLEEREETLSLVRWFCRRYPTPAERLAYVRRAYARWQRS